MNINRFEYFFKNLKSDHFEQCVHSANPLIPRGRKLVPPPDAVPVKSGVLMLFYPEHEELNLLFIRRTEDNGVHSGQIAFPGGRFDAADGDINTLDTALRETDEEIGCLILPENVLNKLSSLYIPPSNYLVDPYIALLRKKPVFKANPAEVAEIIHVPFMSFLSDNCIAEHEFVTKVGLIKAPCYVWNEVHIWGATAIILSECLCLVQKGLIEG